MNEYWKDPRLDDEGTYDYLTDELPADSEKWERHIQKCETCGRYHMFNLVSTHYFYCYDGWDYISYTECWRCRLQSVILKYVAKLRKRRKARKEYKELLANLKGTKLTKEQKRYIRDCYYK